VAGGFGKSAVKLTLTELHPIVTGILVLGTYGAVFFAMTFALRIPEASAAVLTLTRRRRN